MVEEVIFSLFIVHDIAALRPGKRLMLHQLENPPFGLPVTHQNDLAAPLTALFIERINHNAAVLKFKAGQQPVSDPVQI
ncbi:hypothetical protein D3C75_604800 [compost metagenome]